MRYRIRISVVPLTGRDRFSYFSTKLCCVIFEVHSTLAVHSHSVPPRTSDTGQHGVARCRQRVGRTAAAAAVGVNQRLDRNLLGTVPKNRECTTGSDSIRIPRVRFNGQRTKKKN